MSTVTPELENTPLADTALTSGQLPKWAPFAVLAVSLALSAGLLMLLHAFHPALVVIVGGLVFLLTMVILSGVVEGWRRAVDRTATHLVISAFLLALVPLVSVIITTVLKGLPRLDGEFFSSSMRNITGAGGGAIHAIYGTLIVTGLATLIAVPIGMLTAVYLVEYARGNRLGRAITFFVDVMTGIPSIVAGLFAYALFGLLLGPGTKMGIVGAVALAVLMIPTVVRATEEMLRIVPNELRESAYALGVPRWRTILRVVIPTSVAGIVTGVILAIARIIGETAPLLVTTGTTASMNVNAFEGWMATLPVFVYEQYSQAGGSDAMIHRAWSGALTLILIVMLLNAIGRLIAAKFAPKAGR